MLDRARSLFSQARSGQTSLTMTVPTDASERETSDIALARSLVIEELQTAEDRFWIQWDEHGDLNGSIDALRDWHGWRTTLATLESVNESERLTFVVDSLVLQDCYRELFAEPDTESIVYLTGLEVEENVRTLNRCLVLDHAVQSIVGAEADPEASFETLLELETSGHHLQAYAHNHPGTGKESTEPSPTDWENQQSLEDCGYDAIGLILTQDGYVRAFSNDPEFTIKVYGNHVQPVRTDRHVFRLEEPIRTAREQRADA